MKLERIRVMAELAESGLAAASLVHEVRQPLFAIKALAQIGKHKGQMGPADLDELLAAVAHLEGLLDGWRGVGRDTQAGVYDLRLLGNEVLRMLGPRIRTEDVELRVQDGPPIWVEGRPGVARQVLLNLLQNAIDAVAGEPKRTVMLDYTLDDGVGVRVVDSGPGFDEAVVEEMFQPFVTSKGASGTGLGLYVSRALCEEAGGGLSLTRSEEGTVAHALFVVSPTAAVP